MLLVNHEIITSLKSCDPDIQLGALRELGAIDISGMPLDENVISSAMVLIHSNISEIRHAVIFALGLHWACQQIFFDLIKIIQQEENPLVVSVAAEALPLYSGSPNFNKNQVLTVLAKIVSNKNRDSDSRGAAYASMLEISGRIQTKKELASLPLAIEEFKVDWNWVKKLAD